MALKEDLDKFKGLIQDKSTLLQHNHSLFEIYEGELKKYLLMELAEQLSPNSFAQAKHRIAPINILRKVVDKLSKIYMQGVKRYVVEGTGSAKDEELLAYYEESMKLDSKMNIVNEMFNLHKTVDIEPYVSEGIPHLRAVPADRALSMSLDPVDPLRRTHWGKYMGEMQVFDRKKKVWFVYTDMNFIPITEDGEIVFSVLEQLDNPQGINSFEKIPAIYVNRSHFSLIPPPDSDMLKMGKLIPVLLSDLNFAVMMQAFSIIYGIDVDQENLVAAPNAFWNLKSDKTSDKSPQVGQIKPQVDIAEVINLAMTEFSLWMQSKNIKPGSVGTLSVDNLASGVSKMIDEMDTFEDRKKQVEFFKCAEQDMWNLITQNMHPVWIRNGLIDTKLEWTAGVKIRTEFPEQRPAISRKEILDEVVIELREGLTTKDRALSRLNPDLEPSELDMLLKEIQAERTIQIPAEIEEPEVNGDANGNEAPEDKD